MATQKVNPKDLFTLLIAQLKTSAWAQLGENPNPISGKKEQNLEAAAMTIGILETLLYKTAGNLNKSEDKFLAESVRELKYRMAKEAGSN